MPKYVIHYHISKRPHYDLRLELDNKAKSWAIPKDPPKKLGEKRLAVQVEDHNLDYMDFQGSIEEGYGKGKVEIWDKGTWETESVKEKKIVALINGKKLKGRYTILNFKDNNWLFFKSKEKDD